MTEGELSPTWGPDPTPGFDRAIVWVPGWDRRGESPNYGVHGMEIWWLLRGPRGVVVWALSTGWVPPATAREFEARRAPSGHEWSAFAFELGAHALVTPGATADWHPCPYLEGRPADYDGSAARAAPVYEAFLVEGEAAVWAALRAEYARMLRGRIERRRTHEAPVASVDRPGAVGGGAPTEGGRVAQFPRPL